MRTPLGSTRPFLAYGLPAAAGLAVGGALAGQGEDSGTATLGGISAALGARGGLGAARLAGSYAPVVGEIMQKGIAPVGKAVRRGMGSVPKDGIRDRALTGMRGGLVDAYRAAGNMPASAVQKAAAGLAVPGGAALAGLGGVAAGMIPGALGVPGFQQQPVVDPESYGSSNSYGAIYKQTTPQYYG